MDAIQFHIALAIYNEFVDESVEGFEYWRDAAGVLHFVGVSDGAVLEASVYLDEVTYFVFLEHVEEDSDEEEDEEEDDESSDEEFIPKKRSRHE
jgi:hypothetical protein